MKQFVPFIALAALLLIAACDDNHYHDNAVHYDITPPLPPVGIVSISLDNAVELQWYENQEPDVAGYNVYVSHSYNGRYDLIGHTQYAGFVDRGARNGVTYYYAVTAYDFSGNESALSKDVVYDTPRPEGYDVPLVDRFIDPYAAGYDFSAFRITHFDTDYTDVFVEYTQTGVPYFVVWEDTDIQDMGYTRDLDEISVAPERGWSSTKDARIEHGHTYVIWTYDNRFAKMRVTQITPELVRFDWAYQTAEGNPELFRPDTPNLSKHGERKRHTKRVH